MTRITKFLSTLENNNIPLDWIYCEMFVDIDNSSKGEDVFFDMLLGIAMNAHKGHLNATAYDMILVGKHKNQNNQQN